jgi:hypothetical protein
MEFITQSVVNIFYTFILWDFAYDIGTFMIITIF